MKSPAKAGLKVSLWTSQGLSPLRQKLSPKASYGAYVLSCPKQP